MMVEFDINTKDVLSFLSLCKGCVVSNKTFLDFKTLTQCDLKKNKKQKMTK